jgi:hypothetical protein
MEVLEGYMEEMQAEMEGMVLVDQLHRKLPWEAQEVAVVPELELLAVDLRAELADMAALVFLLEVLEAPLDSAQPQVVQVVQGHLLERLRCFLQAEEEAVVLAALLEMEEMEEQQLDLVLAAAAPAARPQHTPLVLAEMGLLDWQLLQPTSKYAIRYC